MVLFRRRRSLTVTANPIRRLARQASRARIVAADDAAAQDHLDALRHLDALAGRQAVQDGHELPAARGTRRLAPLHRRTLLFHEVILALLPRRWYGRAVPSEARPCAQSPP